MERSPASHCFCEPREVAVIGDNHETVDITRVENIHRFDNQCNIRRVLSFRICELLYRLESMLIRWVLPMV